MEKKFFELCSKLVEENGLSLYGLDYRPGQQLLCLYIENPETKSAVLDDCVLIDRAMTPYVEESDWMPEALTLEVSSPGVYREIFEGTQFTTIIGERISLALFPKIEDVMIVEKGSDKEWKQWKGQKKIIAYLDSFNQDSEKITVTFEKASGLKIELSLEDIKKANVEPVWEDIKE